MPKFKVGDQVRYFPPAEKGRYLYGQIGVIDRVGKNSSGIIGYHLDIERNPLILCFDDELELVKPKFVVNEYRFNKFVMHCKTLEESKTFCKYLDSVGRKWESGERYTENSRYYSYSGRTCYNFNEGKIGHTGYYERSNYTVLEFEDFDWSDFEMKKEFTKKDLKSGDLVKRRNGDDCIVCVESDLLMHPTLGGYKLSNIRDDLTNIFNSTNDIVSVRRCSGDPEHWSFDAFDRKLGTLVYEHKEVEEMTLEEVCNALGKEVKIVKEHK